VKIKAFDAIQAFTREEWVKAVMISLALLVPCFWHRGLLMGDLGSHLYNAWLGQLIRNGQAPGLWVAPQWTNVLFDLMLTALVNLLPILLAGRVAVYLASMVFFWGAFSFISAVHQRPVWSLVPALAVITFGWTAQEGLFNYYLSVGLAFLGLAFFWKYKGWWRLTPILLSPLIAIAHPLGFLWFVGGATYVGIAEIVPQRFHFLLVGASGAVLAAVHRYLWHHYRVEAPAHSVFFYNGLDQMVFTNRYLILAACLALFMAISTGLDLLARREANSISAYLVPLQLYIIVEAGVLLLPDAVYWVQFAAPTSRLTERMTSISAVLLFCLLGAVKPRTWHFIALLAVSLSYFYFLYQDTSALSHMEQQAHGLVYSLPEGERVLVTITHPLKYRLSAKHIVDEACIGHCFSYGNYEAPSTQFRIRASRGNRFVFSTIEQAAAMDRGVYVMQPEDLPAHQVYQCGPTWMDLCIHSLKAGEKNDHLGLHPELGIYPEANTN